MTAASREASSVGGTLSVEAASATAFSESRNRSRAFSPVTAVTRRVPADTLSSPTTRTIPISPVLETCVPPQSSRLTPSIETIRTTSGYFSPKSIIAPACLASASGSSVAPTGTAASTLRFTIDSISRSVSAPTAAPCWKSNRRTSASTFDPCWTAWLPRKCWSAASSDATGEGAPRQSPPRR